MNYRRISYSVIRVGDVWKWRAWVGPQRELVKSGEASTERHADAQARQIIDLALDVEQALRSLNLPDC
jgi:hypothetical protein